MPLNTSGYNGVLELSESHANQLPPRLGLPVRSYFITSARANTAIGHSGDMEFVVADLVLA